MLGFLVRVAHLRPLVVVVPQHRAAFGAEASLGRAHLGRLVVLVEREGGNVHPVHISSISNARLPFAHLILSLPLRMLTVKAQLYTADTEVEADRDLGLRVELLPMMLDTPM